MIRPIQRYFASGEINSEVEDVQKVFVRAEKKYGDGQALNWTD
jgi:hypothetical protein